MAGYLDAIYQQLITWGWAFVFVAVFAECLPGIGFLVPGLTVLIFAGLLASGLPLGEAITLFMAAVAGIGTSDMTAYAAGRYLRAKMPVVNKLVQRHADVSRALAQPGLVVLGYQFVPYSRMFLPLIAGAVEVPLARWVGTVAASTALFTTAFFGLGYACGLFGGSFVGANKIGTVISTVFVAGFVIWVVMLILRMRWFRKKLDR